MPPAESESHDPFTPDGSPGSSDPNRAAAEWFARRDRGFSPDEQRAFLAWLEADPAHREAMEAMAHVWIKLEQLREAGADAPAPAPSPSLAERVVQAWFNPGPAIAAAAVLILLASAGLVVDRRASPQPAALPVPTLTATDHIRHARLPDGSTVEMNRSTTIAVDFQGRMRRVRVLRGEADFTVVHDPGRPFIVTAGQALIRDVGTVFDVHLAGAAVDVLVTEGRVQVADEAHPGHPDQGLFVHAGQRAHLNPAPVGNPLQIASLPPAEAARLLSWQGTRLVFDDQSLESVVAEFNRSNDRQLVIGDPAIRDLHVSGSFRPDGLDAFVNLLQMGFGVSAERQDSRIVLRRAGH